MGRSCRLAVTRFSTTYMTNFVTKLCEQISINISDKHFKECLDPIVQTIEKNSENSVKI